MKSTKAQKDSLPHVAYIAIDEPIVEKPADFSFFGDPDAPTLRSLIDRLNQAKHDKKIRAVLITRRPAISQSEDKTRCIKLTEKVSGPSRLPG